MIVRAEEALRRPLTKDALLNAIDDARKAHAVLDRAVKDAQLLVHYLDD